MEQAALVAMGLFMAGVIFGAGRLTARVDALELGIDKISKTVTRLETLMVEGR